MDMPLHRASRRNFFRTALVVAIAALLVLTVTVGVDASHEEPERSDVSLLLVFPDPPDVPHWIYTLTGDVAGVARVDITSSEFHGTMLRWTEVMVVETDDGATITVESRGAWSVVTLGYKTRGTVSEVAGAGGAYDHLAGVPVIGWGYTDSAALGDGSTGAGTLRWG